MYILQRRLLIKILRNVLEVLEKAVSCTFKLGNLMSLLPDRLHYLLQSTDSKCIPIVNKTNRHAQIHIILVRRKELKSNFVLQQKHEEVVEAEKKAESYRGRWFLTESYLNLKSLQQVLICHLVLICDSFQWNQSGILKNKLLCIHVCCNELFDLRL